jgi:hypothetical protein
MGTTVALKLDPGVYLTDEKVLLRIVRANRGEILLEDCAHPDLPLTAMTAVELRGGDWRSVRPLKEAA